MSTDRKRMVSMARRANCASVIAASAIVTIIADPVAQPCCFGGAPVARLVRLQWRGVADDRLDDSPLLFDRVLAREERGIAVHGVAEQAFVRVLFVAGDLARQKLHLAADHALARHLRAHALGDRYVGPEPETHVVGALACTEILA